MGYKKDRQQEVGEKYTDLVSNSEVKAFYELSKKFKKESGMAIYTHFGAYDPKTDSTIVLGYEDVDRWYTKHIGGTPFENEMLRSWLHEMMIPYNWVMFMEERIEPMQWRDRQESKMREKQAEENADMACELPE